MKLVRPHFKILNDDPKLGSDPRGLSIMEFAGRTCYKTEPKGNPEGFLKGIINRGHESVLEHSSVIVMVDNDTYDYTKAQCSYVGKGELDVTNQFLRLTRNFDRKARLCRPIISGSVRAFRDFAKAHAFFGPVVATLKEAYKPLFDDIPDDLSHDLVDAQLLSEADLQTKTERLNHIRRTTWIRCDRGVTHEIVRHRLFGYSQESTRYCNYEKGGAVTFIIPPWVDMKNGYYHNHDHISKAGVPLDQTLWAEGCLESEGRYMMLIRQGWAPQMARTVLNNSVKTEINMTGTLADYHHFFKLRAEGSTGTPHPQMLEVAVPMCKEFQEKFPGLFDDVKLG